MLNKMRLNSICSSDSNPPTSISIYCLVLGVLILKIHVQNEDRTLWKLGSLPPGLITFYNLTYPLDRSWHVLGLGYDPALNETEIEHAAVIHFNGNYKPWLDLAIPKYKKRWSEFVMLDNPYLQRCKLGVND